MSLSPELDRFLLQMEYPATRDDLLREARRDGLRGEDLARLADLPDQSFSAAWRIRYRIARGSLADTLTTREPIPA